MSLYDPRNRKELFLNGVLRGDQSLPDPINREEIYLKAIAEAMPIINESTVVQGVGDSAYDVMSQRAVSEQLENIRDLKESVANIYLTNWTIGRAEPGVNNPISWCCYSDILPVDFTTQYYFDNVKYKVVISFFATDSQPTASTMGGWITTSPFTIPVTDKPYCKINVANVSSSGNVDTDDVADTTYYKQNITGKIVPVARSVSPVYVDSGTGNDSNDGTKTAPLKTIQKAIDLGYGKIFVKAGNYEPFSITNKWYPISISMYDRPDYDPLVENWIKIVSTGVNIGVIISGFGEVNLSDIWIYNSSYYALEAIDGERIVLDHCRASDNTTATFSLFYFQDCNSECRKCEAYNSQVDGFNYHGQGKGDMIDCKSYNNADDGASHHEGFTGTIIGGEFYGNGKAGLAPFSGSKINIYNAYCHDNAQYGIYCAGNAESPHTKSIISGCACINNTTTDIFVAYADATGFSNIYGNKIIGTDGTFTEISS